MPKKWHKRMEDITTLENARAAYKWCYSKTKKGKRFTYSDSALNSLCSRILDGSWYPGEPLEWDHYEPTSDKWRHIIEPTFEMKIVESMVLQVYNPYICRFLHPAMCGSILGRGTKRVRTIIKKWKAKPKKQRKYFARGDIKKCFPSIRIEDAMHEWKRHIGDTRVHNLIWELLTIHGRYTIGLCIGAALAHPTANLVMHGIAVQHGSGIVFQMDDFAFIGGNRRKVEHQLADIVDFAYSRYSLTIHKTEVRLWKDNAIDLAGYRVFWSGKVKVRNKTFHKVTRLIDNFDLSNRQRSRLGSLYGMIKASSSNRLSLYIKERLNDESRKRHKYTDRSLLKSA